MALAIAAQEDDVIDGQVILIIAGLTRHHVRQLIAGVNAISDTIAVCIRIRRSAITNSRSDLVGIEGAAIKTVRRAVEVIIDLGHTAAANAGTGLQRILRAAVIGVVHVTVRLCAGREGHVRCARAVAILIQVPERSVGLVHGYRCRGTAA